MKRLSFSACVLVACLFCATGLRAQQTDSVSSDGVPSAGSASSAKVPRLVRFSGVLRDLAGQPLTGAVDVHFAIYKEEADTAAIWEETQTLHLDGHGRYSVLLGATQPEGLPLVLFQSTEARWLGVSAGELPEQPRVVLASVPYALKASDSDTLGGLPASAYVTTDAASNSSGQSQTPATGQTAIVGLRAEEATSSPSTAVGGTGIMNFLPIWTNGTTLGNSTLYERDGKVGIGNTNPAGTLDVSGGAFIRGALQLPASRPASKNIGFRSNPLDLQASAFNSGTNAPEAQLFRWQAEPVDNNTTSPSGKLSLLFGPGGMSPLVGELPTTTSGTLVETGLSIASNGQLTFAFGQTFPGTGTVTSVGSGAGLTGGPITSSGTLSIATGGVTNAMLANPSLTVTAGTDLTGGGAVALGGSVTLNLDTSKVPTLAASSNTFTGSIAAPSFSGNSVVVNGVLKVGSSPMAFPVLDSSGQLVAGVGAIGFTLGDVTNSSPLTTSELVYFTVPRACTIAGYDLMIDTGTITVKFLKVATGTALPTLASNSISTNGVSISSGTAIHSTTTSDFTTTTVNAFDIMGVAITAVSGAHYLTAEVECK